MRERSAREELLFRVDQVAGHVVDRYPPPLATIGATLVIMVALVQQADPPPRDDAEQLQTLLRNAWRLVFECRAWLKAGYTGRPFWWRWATGAELLLVAAVYLPAPEPVSRGARDG